MEGCATWQRGGAQRCLFDGDLFDELIAKSEAVGQRGCLFDCLVGDLFVCLLAEKREMFLFECSSERSLKVGVMLTSSMRAPL